MQLFINLTIMFVLFNVNAAYPYRHELNKRQLDKLSYAVLPNESTSDSQNGLSIEDASIDAGHLTNGDSQANRFQPPLKPTVSSDSPNRYSNLVSRIVKQILSKRTKSAVVAEYRRRKNVEQLERNDLIKSSLSDKKFRIISELTLKRLKPAFEIQLPDMTPEEHDELVSDINKLINEDGRYRRRDGKR